MNNKLSLNINDLVEENASLFLKNTKLTLALQDAESEIYRLKSELDIADIEMGRLGMVTRRRAESLKTLKRNGKINE